MIGCILSIRFIDTNLLLIINIFLLRFFCFNWAIDFIFLFLFHYWNVVFTINQNRFESIGWNIIFVLNSYYLGLLFFILWLLCLIFWDWRFWLFLLWLFIINSDWNICLAFNNYRSGSCFVNFTIYFNLLAFCFVFIFFALIFPFLSL